MSPDHEHEPREYLSNVGANGRHVSAGRTEFYVACGLHRFEPGAR